MDNYIKLSEKLDTGVKLELKELFYPAMFSLLGIIWLITGLTTTDFPIFLLLLARIAFKNIFKSQPTKISLIFSNILYMLVSLYIILNNYHFQFNLKQFITNLL